MSPRTFRDRRDAGRMLAESLARFASRDDVVVLALPRGGVPVAYEVALALQAPLDVFVVRKVGVPGHEELALGAVASGGVFVRNEGIVRRLDIPMDELDRLAAKAHHELVRRERTYRGFRPPVELGAKVLLLVDDGLATGSSMRAAVAAVRSLDPARIVVAVPVAPKATCREFAAEVDEVVCTVTPWPFRAVGEHYRDFTQVTDEEVSNLLR